MVHFPSFNFSCNNQFQEWRNFAALPVFDFVSVVVSSGIISIGEKTMKAELMVGRGVIAVVFAGLLAGGTYAESQDPTLQQQDIQNDKKDVRNDKKDLAKDRADRNADQRDINHDRKDLNKDRKDRNQDQRDINKDKRDLHRDHRDLRHDKRGH